MTSQAQRRTIAEACGWKQVSGVEAAIDGAVVRDKRFDGFARRVIRWNQSRVFGGWKNTPGFHQLDIDESNSVSTAELLEDYDVDTAWRSLDGHYCRSVPNYLADLNAIHKAWKTVIEPDALLSLRYYQNLCGLIENNPDGTVRFGVCFFNEVTNATAAQRTEAFLRTIDKWVPST